MSGRCFNLTGRRGWRGFLHNFKTQFPHSRLISQHRWRAIATAFLENPGKCENLHSKDPRGKKKKSTGIQFLRLALENVHTGSGSTESRQL